MNELVTMDCFLVQLAIRCLIVPRLIFSTGMPIINAVGTPLKAVGAFGLATVPNYARSGMVDWTVAVEVLGGGAVDGWISMRIAYALALSRNVLRHLFALLVVAVGIYVSGGLPRGRQMI